MHRVVVLCAILIAFSFASQDFIQKKHLIQTGVGEEPVWITSEEMLLLVKEGVTFMDVTNFRLDDGSSRSVPAGPPLPNQPQQKPYVNSLLSELSTANLESNVNTLSSFHTRFYSTSTMPQPSVIARIEGQESDDIVILGSHEDSIHIGAFGRAPGVDDDGSGTVCSLEVFRVLVESGFQPNRTVEFHYYAAEEVGLKGSQAVAEAYAAEEKVIVGMMQLDMTFYVGTGDENVVGVVTDNVDDSLTAFTRQLVESYCTIPWQNTVCGYGCSDHASWTKEGYRSTFPFETPFEAHNPYIHTEKDTTAYANFDHGLEFAKLGLGFVVELAATEYMS